MLIDDDNGADNRLSIYLREFGLGFLVAVTEPGPMPVSRGIRDDLGQKAAQPGASM
jgi:hypothetical protein